jgi:hypothetical protein
MYKRYIPLQCKGLPFLLGFLVLFASCAPKKQHSKLTWQDLEARLSEIVLPLGSRVVESHEHENGFYVEFKTDQEVPALATLYLHEMERLGWWLMAKSIERESVLVFEKPYSLCVISCRRGGHETAVTLSTMAKNKGLS